MSFDEDEQAAPAEVERDAADADEAPRSVANPWRTRV